MGNERKTVYIPIEIKFREYPGALILAASLCDKGARVYISSKSAIYDIIFSKKDKAGVFLYKGTKHREFFLRLKEKVQLIAILDQELGVAHDLTDKDYSEAVLDRFIFGTEDLIDFYFVIGSRYRAAVAATVPLLKSKISTTGWPKFDLLTKYRKETYSIAANQIRSKYGEFLLFSSDFGSNTPQKLMGAHLQDAKSGSNLG